MSKIRKLQTVIRVIDEFLILKKIYNKIQMKTAKTMRRKARGTIKEKKAKQ